MYHHFVSERHLDSAQFLGPNSGATALCMNLLDLFNQSEGGAAEEGQVF